MSQNQHLDLTGEELSSVMAEMQMDTHARFELAEFLQVQPLPRPRVVKRSPGSKFTKF